MSEPGHQLSTVHVPSAPRLLKGSCSCGEWAMIAETRETLVSYHETHVLVMRFAPEGS